MLFKIENIGMIQRAEVYLDGLTVIAGENDTGKSTVGRLLFAIVKALSRYEQDLEESKESKMVNIAEDIYFLIRKFSPHYISSNRREGDLLPREDLLREFHPRNFIISFRGQENLSENESILDEKRHKLLLLLENIEENSGPLGEIRDRILQRFDRLKETLLKEESKEDIIQNALKKTFFTEFYFEITPKNNKNSISKIAISEGESRIIEIKIQSNKIDSFNLYDDLFFSDATFIESPIYLQLYNLISRANTLLENSKSSRISQNLKVALHIKDLISKMENAQYPQLNELFPAKLHELEQKISSIVDSKGFKFSRDEKDFLFYKTEDLSYRPINTASGIKAFGIIQLLLSAEILDERHPLIIDEPETHLHPAWQVKYAEIIVELVKYGIPVILTSHSPYIVQALKVFSEKGGITSQTHFYFAERTDDNMSVISEVTDDLNRIFTKLSKPLLELVWK